MAFDVEWIATLLDKHHQRATYGAVAKYLSQPHRSLMTEFPKQPLFSWIVSAETGEPTNYPARAIHPDLHENGLILSTEEELREWIRSLP